MPVLQYWQMARSHGNGVRAFVFDLDGTLIDSKMDIVNSVNMMLAKMRRDPLPLEVVASYIGHGAPRLIACALGSDATDEERKTGLGLFLESYEKHALDETRAYPGVQDGLETLAGCPMAVLTNKPLKMSLQILEGLELAKYFQAIYGGDSFATKKPEPSGVLTILRELRMEPGEAAMVGDSDVDVQTARNAAMKAVAVNYGFGEYDRTANPADVYLDRFIEITSLRN